MSIKVQRKRTKEIAKIIREIAAIVEIDPENDNESLEGN